VTQGIDCRKVALHWVVRAWQQDGTGYTIDHGIHEVRGTIGGSDEGVDLAIRRAVIERMEDVKDGYHRLDGEVVPIALTLVDAGWRTEAVYQACREIGLGIMPAMGFGRSAGCVRANFGASQQRTKARIPGDGWFLTKRDQQIWLVAMDADRWKAWEHDRWMTDPAKRGTLTLFGEPLAIPRRLSFDEKLHFSYSKHITAEIEVEEIVKGALVRGWKSKSDNNHWLDASYMSNVAANIKGIRLLREDQQAKSAKPRPEPVIDVSIETPFLASAR